MSVHTPGPWKHQRQTHLASRRDQFVIKANDDGCSADVIATTPYIDKKTWHEANARLIAAAPELLEHLRNVVEMASSVTANWENGDLDAAVRNLDRIATAAQTAIAKAEATDSGTTIVIEVTGGVAEITRCPDDIEVESIDHDNP